MVIDMTSRSFKSILIVPVLLVPAFAGDPAKPVSEPKPPAIARAKFEPAGPRVFELRTYYTNEGKLDDLHKRFRDHTCELLKKHGAELIGFWTPQDDKDGKGSRLIYLLAFPSREAAEKTWKEFRDDPEWKKVYAESHKNGVLVKKVESVFLVPTDYSALK
jgi:NIPSNAP